MVIRGQELSTTGFNYSGATVAKSAPPLAQGFSATGGLHGNHINPDPNDTHKFSWDGKNYTIPHVNEGDENKITITLPDGRTESFATQEEAEAELERVKINLFYELTMSSISASSYAEIAKTLFGNKVDNSGRIQVPAEVTSSIESAMQSDSQLTGDGLHKVGEVLGKQNPLYVQELRKRKEREANLKSSPALFLGQDELKKAGIDTSLFAVGTNLNDVSIGDLESLVNRLEQIHEHQQYVARKERRKEQAGDPSSNV